MAKMSLSDLFTTKKKVSESPKKGNPPEENKEEKEEKEIEMGPFEIFCKEHSQFDEKTNRVWFYILHYRPPFPISVYTLWTRLRFPEIEISEICERLTTLKLIRKISYNDHIAFEKIESELSQKGVE